MKLTLLPFSIGTSAPLFCLLACGIDDSNDSTDSSGGVGVGVAVGVSVIEDEDEEACGRDLLLLLVSCFLLLLLLRLLMPSSLFKAAGEENEGIGILLCIAKIDLTLATVSGGYDGAFL